MSAIEYVDNETSLTCTWNKVGESVIIYKTYVTTVLSIPCPIRKYRKNILDMQRVIFFKDRAKFFKSVNNLTLLNRHSYVMT